MKTLKVRLGERSYPILIGDGLLAELGHLIKAQGFSKHNILVVTQKPIAEFYRSAVQESLQKEGFECSFFLPHNAKSSEASKSQAVFLKLIQAIVSLSGKNKSLLLVALGGGVVGDLTGFAASVYRRGTPYIQVPTTLTAQVDSAIGGKTGIDIPEGKNLLGTIFQPALVLSDVSLLGSMPERHWSDGFAEVIKYGMIRDADLFRLLEKSAKEKIRSHPALLEKIIYESAKIKAGIVEKDELDKKGIRMVLNFGHTTGHAIETAAGFSRQYTHGEAVSIGMLAACDLAKKLNVLQDAGLPARLEQTLVRFGLPLYFKGISVEAVLKAMGYDKKSSQGSNRFILPVSLGKTRVFHNIPEQLITETLTKRKG